MPTAHAWAHCALQAMHKLGEPTALVKARQADTMLVKEVMEPARKQYAGTQQDIGHNRVKPSKWQPLT